MSDLTVVRHSRDMGIEGWHLALCATCEDGAIYVEDGSIEPPKCNTCRAMEAKTMSKKNKKNGQNGAQLAADTTNPETGAERKEIKRYTDELAVRIDDAAVATLADDLAKLLGEIELVEDAKKTAVSGFKEKIDGLKALVKEKADSVRSKTVRQPVEVREFLNPDNSIEVIRVDTGETIETRTAESDDLQTDMFDEGDDDLGEDGPASERPVSDTDPAEAPTEGSETGDLALEQEGA